MKKVGIVGLGDMGIGMAKNLLKDGFELTVFDIKEDRLNELAELGGKPAANCQEIAENSDIVIIMVLNGEQVKDVVLGEFGLLKGLKPGATIIVSATINPSEIKELETPVYKKESTLSIR